MQDRKGIIFEVIWLRTDETEEPLYRSPEKSKAIRMRAYWKNIHPDRLIRIDRLTRTEEEPAL